MKSFSRRSRSTSAAAPTITPNADERIVRQHGKMTLSLINNGTEIAFVTGGSDAVYLKSP